MIEIDTMTLVVIGVWIAFVLILSLFLWARRKEERLSRSRDTDSEVSGEEESTGTEKGGTVSQCRKYLSMLDRPGFDVGAVDTRLRDVSDAKRWEICRTDPSIRSDLRIAEWKGCLSAQNQVDYIDCLTSSDGRWTNGATGVSANNNGALHTYGSWKPGQWRGWGGYGADVSLEGTVGHDPAPEPFPPMWGPGDLAMGFT